MASPSALDPDEEVRRFEYKVQAGAEFAILSPAFDLAACERFLRRIEGCRIPVIAGLRPLESLRHAEYLANEVPGVSIAPQYLARMRAAGEPERAAAEGLAIAREMAAGLRPHVQGVQLGVSPGALEVVLDLLEALAPASAMPGGRSGADES
jgi:homocysteine S-methyltransferase